tara:strand:+ start:837 stop:956 length:120 start_codon:yes stop_codon:yes gene_type:complete
MTPVKIEALEKRRNGLEGAGKMVQEVFYAVLRGRSEGRG